MERSPLKSRWAEFFIKIHHEWLFRRQVLKNLYDNRLEFTILTDMFKRCFCCLLTSIMSFYILRKEAFYIKFLFSAGPFSVSSIYLQFYYEENLYYYKGLENNTAGKIIRKKYLELRPESWLAKNFRVKEEEFQTFFEKYHYRENPMEKFHDLIEKKRKAIKD